MDKPFSINFTKMMAGKPLQGDGLGSKPVPRTLTLTVDQFKDIDTSDRVESLKIAWPEFLASIQATAATNRQGAGNVTPIIAVGPQAPYEIVAGRRRYLACKELGLSIDAKVYPFLSDDEKTHFKYSENFIRNNYSAYEIVANIKREIDRGKDRKWLCIAIGKSIRSIDAYIAIAKDPALTEEIKRGLSLREAFRLQQEFGKDAAIQAAHLRDAGSAQEQTSNPTVHSKRKNAEKAVGREALVTKVIPGAKVQISFNEKKAGKKDLQTYGQWLDTERERVGALIDARSRRGQARA